MKTLREAFASLSVFDEVSVLFIRYIHNNSGANTWRSGYIKVGIEYGCPAGHYLQANAIFRRINLAFIKANAIVLNR